MWAQTWVNINDIVNPYYVKDKETATDEMVKQVNNGWKKISKEILAFAFFNYI